MSEEKTFVVTITAIITAENEQQAEEKYAEGDYIIDFHEFERDDW